ncbi:MAG: hypothetical protein WCO48_01450 [Candidatus Taylorbacteria bacterium]
MTKKKITGAITDPYGYRCSNKKCSGPRWLNGPMLANSKEEVTKYLKITFVYLSQFAKEVEVIPIETVSCFWNAQPIYLPIKNIVLAKSVPNPQTVPR